MAVTCPKCQAENTETSLFCSGCGTKLGRSAEFSPFQTETLQTSLKELTTGSTFANRYQIIEELGKGGMGKVYKVFDQEVQAKMALKLIKPEVSADKNTIDRFRNELKIARDISHKNICRMYDLGREAGNYFITMEYVSGEDLRSFIRRSRQLVVGTAIFIAKQVCEGLAEAHRVGVVHRDLKPGNIMIDKDGNAKIMDFGIARAISAKGITGAGVMIGTPEYMSPEQVEGKEVDQRSDIYSLGIILYEMLTGQVPFEGDTAFTIGVKQKSEIPKDPRDLNSQIPQDLSRLILKCLEKDKGRRYQNADELKASLEKIEKGIPTAERPVPKRKTITSKPITLTISRKKFLVPLSILVAIALIGIGLWRFLPKRHVAPSPTGKPTLAILYFENISGDKILDPWKTALTELLITKLSQSKFISVLDGNTIYSILKRLSLDEAKKYTKEDLLKIANEGNATYTLSGSLMKAGPNLLITLSLQKPHTGEVVSTPNIECKGEEEIFPKVDELAKTIRSDLKLTPDQIASDFDKEVGKITTDSPEAYKYYVEARKQHHDDKNSEAIELYQKAISIDPGFAMAYRGMAAAYSNLGFEKKDREAMQKAMEFSDRVSERERYLIQGRFYGFDAKTLDKAIESFNKLLELYPDDTIGANYLGNLYSDLEEWDKALPFNEMEAKLEKNWLSYENLAGNYESMGLYQKAREVYEDYLKNISDSPDVHRLLGRNYLAEGKFDLALAEADKAYLVDPKSNDNLVLKGDILYLQDDLAGAEKEYQKLLEAQPDRYPFNARGDLASIDLRRGNFGKAIEQHRQQIELAQRAGEKAWEAEAHDDLSYLYWRQGKIKLAEAEVDSLAKIADEESLIQYKTFSLFGRSLLFVEKRSLSEASKTAEEAKRQLDSIHYEKGLRWYLNLMGIIELQKNDLPKAINYFEQAVSLDPSPDIAKDSDLLDWLGLGYFRNGDLDKARQAYKKISSQLSSKWSGDIYAKSFYMLGKIAEQQGDKGRAVENYQKFLDLWKDADPGIPEVEETKQRLNKLKS
jgi:serine/threonine protein kinase/Flp pilus assembly protein TadD